MKHGSVFYGLPDIDGSLRVASELLDVRKPQRLNECSKICAYNLLEFLEAQLIISAQITLVHSKIGGTGEGRDEKNALEHATQNRSLHQELDSISSL